MLFRSYFGGGMGIVMLAMLAALGMTDIHAMNALKSVMGSVINGVAVVTFILARAVYWKHGMVMIAGGIAGGYLGAHYAMKMPPKTTDPHSASERQATSLLLAAGSLERATRR